MGDLFSLSMPWWQFALRGIACYIGLLVLLRMTGKRAFGEMAPFDIVVLILVGGALRSAIVGKDDSLLGPFIGVTSILAADKVLGYLSAVSPAFGRLMEGTPVLLARGGRVLPGALRRQSISRDAFDRELRAHSVHSVAQVEEALLEPNGRVSIFKRSS